MLLDRLMEYVDTTPLVPTPAKPATETDAVPSPKKCEDAVVSAETGGKGTAARACEPADANPAPRKRSALKELSGTQ